MEGHRNNVEISNEIRQQKIDTLVNAVYGLCVPMGMKNKRLVHRSVSKFEKQLIAQCKTKEEYLSRLSSLHLGDLEFWARCLYQKEDAQRKATKENITDNTRKRIRTALDHQFSQVKTAAPRPGTVAKKILQERKGSESSDWQNIEQQTGNRSAVFGPYMQQISHNEIQVETSPQPQNFFGTSSKEIAMPVPSQLSESDLSWLASLLASPEDLDDFFKSLCYDHEASDPTPLKSLLLKEIDEIIDLIEIRDMVMDFPTEVPNENAMVIGKQGIVLQISTILRPVSPIKLLILKDYPHSSPILLDATSAKTRNIEDTISAKGNQRLHQELQSHPEPVSLKTIVQMWNTCIDMAMAECGYRFEKVDQQ